MHQKLWSSVAVLSLWLAGCAAEIGPGSDRSSLTESERDLLASIGVANVDVRADRASLLDADGNTIGEVTVGVDGTLRAQLADAQAIVRPSDAGDLVECNGVAAYGMGADAVQSALAPCAAVLTAATVIFGEEPTEEVVGAAREALLAAPSTVCGVACETTAVSIYVVGDTVWVTHHCSNGWAVTHAIGSNCHSLDH